MIKIIAFDIDGVLVDTTKADKIIFSEIFENASANTGKSVKELRNALNEIFPYPSYKWYDWNEKLRRIGCDLKFEDLYKKYANLFKVYNDVISTLKKLKSQGKFLFAVSDGYEILQKNNLKAKDLMKYFDGLFTSDNCGVIKKDKRYFKCFLKLINARLNEVAFIDNSEYPILAARKVGIITIRIDRKHKTKETKANYLIHSLKELFPLISRF